MNFFKLSKYCLGAGLMVLTACAQQPDRQAAGERERGDRSNGMARDTLGMAEDPRTYTGQLQPINEQVTGAVTGEAVIDVRDDSVQVQVNVEEIPEGIANLQFLLGFPSEAEARCPAMAGNGAGNGYGNGMGNDTGKTHKDGTPKGAPRGAGNGMAPPSQTQSPSQSQTTAGIPMIQLQDDRPGMPEVIENGFSFQQTLSRSQLETAARQQFGLDTLNYENMVLYVQGISETGTTAPERTAPGTRPQPETPGAQAGASMPIACAEFQMQANGASNGY